MIDSPEEIAAVREFFAGLPVGEQRRLMQFFVDEFQEEPVCPKTETAVEESLSGNAEVNRQIIEAIKKETERRQKEAAALLSSKPDSSGDTTTPPLKDI